MDGSASLEERLNDKLAKLKSRQDDIINRIKVIGPPLEELRKTVDRLNGGFGRVFGLLLCIAIPVLGWAIGLIWVSQIYADKYQNKDKVAEWAKLVKEEKLLKKQLTEIEREINETKKILAIDGSVLNMPLATEIPEQDSMANNGSGVEKPPMFDDIRDG